MLTSYVKLDHMLYSNNASYEIKGVHLEKGGGWRRIHKLYGKIMWKEPGAFLENYVEGCSLLN